ncbi:MAG: hypothetical protein A3D24_02245 [Candidatus Blackburnbacteria bacterium RIFCSPHIGHO2_02_FULL_39_13]|uniref:Uncharacterized protein n=1 Tax=Candidatus Blackburnbacteria bacterium RIFCSPLOWO2_01_FULL_40_20 TaxID=1797519 RepID=A0A1G1VB78_9BACT|nr:MAG: hypothetical protein A2694_02935 [Candidatus Blackburnbacteria bacterium RIFCSPHIGHO2_01_FULL_40_17]OGY09503.1 MAG: hypothetical protein A3D24_02245 [Candidatus Blackburnbacteria bacterium RIFCSPHIGHO2_02_FULL_39_13]OGY12517.1 MAG: hypothetical protein A3A77_00915 [Candidatus Blackburnbacteria bacterium RIFCSPLOWO2_01_FULL_40_20]OGY15124.1 MAG: hypothetical protein A3I52_00030 [Candidatus Blackburnbacteria bacterium RIFCSPLOWO2_02_FULL_40_10]HBL51661.1 hypothetical protein [Candidatus B
MKTLKHFFANRLEALLVFTLVLVCIPLITSNTSIITKDTFPISIVHTKIDCSNIEGYKNWLSTNKDTLIPKPYGTDGYLIESINPLGIDHTVYIVTCNERLNKDDEWTSQTQAVLVYSSVSKSILDFSLMDEYINFVSTGDVNDNNIEDVVIQMATGGNCWSCEWKEIFEAKDDKVALLTKNINIPQWPSNGDSRDYGQAVFKVEDLDGDGVKELIVSTSVWEMAFDFCHACSPGIQKVYKWSGTSYEEDKKSDAYISFHKKWLESSLVAWKDDGCDNSTPNGGMPSECLQRVIDVLLEYDALGMRGVGWKFFWNNTNPEFFKKKYVGEEWDSITRVRSVLKKQYDNNQEFSPDDEITSSDVQFYFPIKYNSFWAYDGVKKELVEGIMETTESKKYVEVVNYQYMVDGSIDIKLGDDSNYLIRGSTIDFEPQSEQSDKFTLTLPLSVGQKWGDEDQLKNRTDGYYVWEVEEKFSQEVLGKKYDECFRIALKMLTGKEYRIFCYGVGIVEEGYKHNGSLHEEISKLTAYQ